jgi:hypothetical protein
MFMIWQVGDGGTTLGLVVGWMESEVGSEKTMEEVMVIII